jgi:hypothetical protein
MGLGEMTISKNRRYGRGASARHWPAASPARPFARSRESDS